MKTIKTSMQRSLKQTFALFLCVLGAAMIAQADDLIVFKGSSVRVAVGGIQKITIANPAIIDAKPATDGQSVLVSGLAEGNSELRIATLQGSELVTNVVVRSDVAQMLDEIKQLLSDVEGLNITVVGNKIVLQGNIITKSDYDKVTKVVGAYSSIILNMSTFDVSGMNKYVEQAILQDIGISTVTAHVVGDTVVLEGTVYSQTDLKRAEEVARLRMPNVKNLITVQDVMIETDVQFVQISGDKSKDMGYNVLDSLGVSLGGTATGGTGSGGRIPITFGASATASAQLKALLGNGTGKIVASPHISTKSGEEGSFQSGGTTYFEISGSVGGNLQSVDYGVILKVKPTLQGHDQILNQVTIEVSMPVGSGGGVLQLQKYSTSCTSLCKIGESMVMSGMVQQTANSTSSKTPVLGDVPLLDLFFSNKQSDKSRNEFVIVVTPQPVFASAAAGTPFGEQHKQLLQDAGKDSKE
jgi:pilus assembly protein CpaC